MVFYQYVYKALKTELKLFLNHTKKPLISGFFYFELFSKHILLERTIGSCFLLK